MKKLYLSVCLAAAGLIVSQPAAKAQLTDGAIAPDWTLTDINGTTWHLYDLLDQGKSVFIDVFAVWCGPCWSYHNTGNLDALYEDYGPDGTDQVMVFQIEGDGTSTLDEMNGIGAGTQGDWVGGTPYPSILTHVGDPSYSVIGDYDIAYFPTIYRICPNRIIKEVGQASEAVLYNSVGDCEVASVNNDPGIFNYTGPTVGCSDVELSVTIQNMGFDPLTACTIKAFNGATELLSKDWTGNLPLYSMENVTLGTVALTDPSTDIDIQITSADDNTLNNSVSTTIEYNDNVTMTVHLEVRTDGYPTQTHWEIIDESTGAQIYEDGPYTNAQKNMVVFDEDLTMPGLGCYQLNFYDTGGDGLTGSAYYKLYDANGDLLSSGFESIGYKKSDALKVTGMNAIESNDIINSFAVYPNPANDAAQLEVNFESAQDVSITVTDLMGRTIRTIANENIAAGVHVFSIPVSDLAGGIYFVQLTGNHINQSVTLTVAH